MTQPNTTNEYVGIVIRNQSGIDITVSGTVTGDVPITIIENGSIAVPFPESPLRDINLIVAFSNSGTNGIPTAGFSNITSIPQLDSDSQWSQNADSIPGTIVSFDVEAPEPNSDNSIVNYNIAFTKGTMPGSTGPGGGIAIVGTVSTFGISR